MYKTIPLNENFYLEMQDMFNFTIKSDQNIYGILHLEDTCEKLTATLWFKEEKLSREECASIASKVLDFLKFGSDKTVILNTKDEQLIASFAENEYYGGIGIIINQIEEAERFLTSYNKYWREVYYSTNYRNTEYSELVEMRQTPLKDVLYGYQIIWPGITFDKTGIKINECKSNIDYKANYSINENSISFSALSLNGLRIKQRNIPSKHLKEIQIDVDDLSLRIFSTSFGRIYKAHACIYINKNASNKKGKTKGTYHIDINKHTGFDIYYTDRHGKLRDDCRDEFVFDNLGLWEKLSQCENTSEFIEIVNCILQEKKNKNISDALFIPNIKNLVVNIPVPIISRTISDICYEIRPKKEKAYARTRK